MAYGVRIFVRDDMLRTRRLAKDVHNPAATASRKRGTRIAKRPIINEVKCWLRFGTQIRTVSVSTLDARVFHLFAIVHHIIIQAYTVHAQAIRRRCVIFVLMSRARTTINIRMLLLQQCAEEERLIWFTERNERAIYRTWSLLTYPPLQFYWRSRFSRASDAFLNWRVRLHTPTDSHISVNLNSGKRTNDSKQCRCQQQ